MRREAPIDQDDSIETGAQYTIYSIYNTELAYVMFNSSLDFQSPPRRQAWVKKAQVGNIHCEDTSVP